MSKRIVLFASLASLASSAFAITGGPNMPEYVQFEEVSANNLVDPNSGNFTYVIPLLEVPGPGGTYPLALSYHSGIRYNQEASWVGLGWSLNAGAINRVLRGVPDDYFNSMVATRNRLEKSGSSIGVNMGVGPLGMALSWDANTGQFQGASPYVSLSTAMIPGAGALASVASVGVTWSPGGVSVGLSGTLPVGSVSIGLYNSANNSAGSPTFSAGLSGGYEKADGSNLSVGVSAFHTSGSTIGATAGEGDMNFAVNGFTINVGYFHLGVSQTDWRYSLDEAVIDYMNGFLFQDGAGAGFINRVPEARSFVVAPTTPPPPRQKYERVKSGTTVFPSGDLYMVNGNGMVGTFQPYIQPGANVPVIYEDGSLIETPASFNDITFRMDGDKGYNLLHDQGAVAGQLPYGEFDYPNGNATKMRQYGSYRIMPIFTKPEGANAYKNILNGFIIRNADGMQYEYRQPVFTLLQADYAFTDPMEATESDRMGKVNGERYANAWLMTAIKGADYLSSNSGRDFPAEGDLGHWVKFNYTTPTVVNWSAPDKGNAPPEDKASAYYTRAYGIRQQTFLSSIETQTHKAVFETADRVDVPASKNNPTNNPSGQSDRMTMDDGMLANRYDGGYGGDEWPTYTINPSGGFPIQFQDPERFVHYYHIHVAGGFRMTFPGDWGTLIKNYRRDHCYNSECTELNTTLEKFFGLHIKYTYLAAPACPNGGCQGRQVATNDRVFVGKNVVTHDYDSKDYGFNFEFHCPTVNVNAEGNTEVTCSIDMWTGVPGKEQADIQNMRVYTAFLNWPELENLKILDYSKRPRALSSIKLYNKTSPAQITKEILFGYDYSLCNHLYPEHPGISDLAYIYLKNGTYVSFDNENNKGKLTLKKVSVYGNGGHDAGSGAKVPDYSFGYQSGAANPDYMGMYNQDIWGMYAPSATQTSRGVKQTNTAAAGAPPNGGEMVGVAWNLNRINLPTGGHIDIDYKRDEYFFATMMKDPSSDPAAQKYMAFPDIYDLELPKTTTGTPSVDWNKFYRLTINETQQNVGINLSANNATGKNIPTLSTGPDGKDDYAVTALASNPIEPVNGELALVAFVMDRAPYNSPTVFTPAFTGVVNIAVVNRTDVSTQKRVRLTPLVQKDANNRFFYYANFHHTVTGGANFRFSYYIIPIRNADRRFFGGDVAVKSIKTYDGLGGQPLTKQYDYFSQKLRDSQGNYLSGADFPVSSGATWTMPEMLDKDKYQRYWFAGTDRSRNLNFDPWPYWCAMSDGKPNTCGTDPSGYVTPPQVPTKNILTKFLDDAFEQETLPGVQNYPGAGVTYSRPRESLVNSQGYTLGYTETQFYNLAHNFQNNTAAHNQATPTKNYEIPDWVNFGGLVTAKLTALSGKLMRKYEVSPSEAIVKRNEYEYATDVTVYKCATTSQCQTPSETVPLGAVQQRTGWKSGGAATYVSVRTPIAHLVKDISVIQGVRNEVQSLAFDSKSGIALASAKINSDNRGVVSYAVPLHWNSTPALTANRLNAVSEERTYALPAGTTFDRNALARVISARANVWATVPVRTLWGQQQQSAHLYNIQSHVWRAALGSDGLATTPYSAPDAAFGPPWAPEKPKVTLTNLYSYPMETRDEITGLTTASYTGHNTNLVTGIVANAKWREATILTCDYVHPDNPNYFDALTGWRRDISGTASLVSAPVDVGLKVIRLENGGTIYTNHILLDPSKRRKYSASFRALVNTGTLTLTVRPNVGTEKNIWLEEPYFRSNQMEIDLTEEQYAGATSLYVEVKSSAGAQGFIQEIRVHPSDALASSFFYDPITYKLVGTLDENGEYRKFTYDARGRLTTKINNWGVVTEEYQYKDMANPQ